MAGRYAFGTLCALRVGLILLRKIPAVVAPRENINIFSGYSHSCVMNLCALRRGSGPNCDSSRYKKKT